ncbi:MAG: hypothetical protein DI542_16530 [Acinetobacter johnsonii]|uniref:Uncharacterized protein n=1 Tax=Acinetobacter johnsonii TaxID=40214 RepID=A0A2W5R8L7_ACIJO|nr:MAG: hypothetical protein DI542_16530 [Acinetobacter johnsonii]
MAAGGWVIRCPRWPAAAGGGGDLVRGGPRAAAGSGPRVATAGGPAGEPVLQVAPGPAPGSVPAARRVNRFCRWLPARRRAQGPGWPPVGGPVLRVAPGPAPGSGALGRRRTRGPRWPAAAGGGVIWCAVGPGPPRARGPGWPLSAAVRVIRWGGGPRAVVGTWCPGSPMSSVPKVATAGGPAGEPVLQVAPGPPTSPGLRVATAGGQAGEPVLQVPAARRVNRFCRWLPARRRAQGPGWPPVGGPVLQVVPGPSPGSGALGRRRARGPGWERGKGSGAASGKVYLAGSRPPLAGMCCRRGLSRLAVGT